jgi:hypothetical protein
MYAWWYRSSSIKNGGNLFYLKKTTSISVPREVVDENGTHAEQGEDGARKRFCKNRGNLSKCRSGRAQHASPN